MHQGDEEEDDQYYGNPLEETRFDLSLGEFIAADGAAHAVFGHLHRTVGTFFSLGTDQIPFLLP